MTFHDHRTRQPEIPDSVVVPLKPAFPRQLALFPELVEMVTTDDGVFEANDGSCGTLRVKPPGPGWTFLDETERTTLWIRRLPIPSREAEET